MATRTHTRRVKRRNPQRPGSTWIRPGDAVKYLRRRGIRVSRRTVLRWIKAGAVTSTRLPGCRSWWAVSLSSLLEAARCYAK